MGSADAVTGAELTHLEATVDRRSANSKHLSTVLAYGRPVLTADVEMAAALARAVLEVSA